MSELLNLPLNVSFPDTEG